MSTRQQIILLLPRRTGNKRYRRTLTKLTAEYMLGLSRNSTLIYYVATPTWH